MMSSTPVNILLIEDEPAHAEIVRRSFQGFHIANHLVHMIDGKSALDYLKNTGPYAETDKPVRPRLILLDLRIPKIDGLELLRILKEDVGLHNLPVVVLTTSTNEQDIIQAYKLGASSYLVKPVGFKDFSAMMNTLGEYWLGWNQFPV